MNPYVILKPVITEKSLRMAKEENSFTFYVDPRADKRAIKEAIETGYSVTVQDLKTVHLPGKTKRTGSKRRSQRQPDLKKAIVILPKGQKIPVFDL
jgi:large subunit ribosomal protein L23